MKMKIKVVPNADRDEVSEKDNTIFVKVKAPARDNKANIAVIKLLRKRFGKDVRLVSGLNSKRKVVEVAE